MVFCQLLLPDATRVTLRVSTICCTTANPEDFKRSLMFCDLITRLHTGYHMSILSEQSVESSGWHLYSKHHSVIFCVGGGVVDRTVTSQQDDSEIETCRPDEPCCGEFASSPRACVGFLRVLWRPPKFKRHAGLG